MRLDEGRFIEQQTMSVFIIKAKTVLDLPPPVHRLLGCSNTC